MADLHSSAALRRERRAAARRYHPDVGGDPQEYLRVLAGIDARYTRADPPIRSSDGGTGVMTWPRADGPAQAQRRARRAVRRARRLSRLLRSRLPRRVPGARRYTQVR